MIPFAIVVFSVGMADLVAGFSGRPTRFLRCSFAWIVGVGAAIGTACALDFDTDAMLILGSIVAAFLLFWLLIRATDELRVGRGAVAFWAILLVFAGLIATDSQWPPSDGGRLSEWIANVPIAGFGTDSERVIVCAALVMFLLATANGVVRLILAMSSEDEPQDDDPDNRESPIDEQHRLRGGRMIGPVERLLIFGFVVAGQVTAAVFVVSAKALLRFPEVNRESPQEGPQEIHRLNEYLVVGSLGSWALAFVAAALLRGSIP